MGRNLKFLITIFLFILLYGAYYWGITAIVNLPERSDIIEKTVFAQTGYKLSLKNPQLKTGLIPSVLISADEAAILNDDNSKALVIEKFSINIKLLPLIFKKIDIKQISAENIIVNLVFDKDLKLKLGQNSLENPPKSPFTLRHAAVKLGAYSVNLDDKVQSKKINLDGKYLTVNDFTNGRHIDLSTIAELNTGNKSSSFQADVNLKLPLNRISNDQLEISGSIVNLDLSDFSAYAKSLSDNKIKSLSGVINSTASTELTQDNHKRIKTNIFVNNPGIFKDDIASSIYSKDKLEINADVNTINNGIEINDAQIKGNGINAFLSGKITKLDSRLPNLDIKVGVNNSKAENILPLLPGEADLSPDMNLLLLKQTGFWGDASANLEIKGKADYPNVYGNVLVTNAYMVKPIPNAKKAAIKLAFKGDKFDLDVKVPTSPSQTVSVKGPINLDKERSADLQITSTKNVDLKTAQIVLNPLHDILHFDIGPVPIMDIQGTGGINLHVIGTRKDPHGWGQFWFNNASVSFLDINNMVLKNGSGTLDFNNQDTLFQTKTASLNGKPVSINGTCSLIGVLDFDVIAKSQDLGKLLTAVKTSPMLEDIQKLLEPVEKAGGNADFKLNLTGQVKDVNDVVFNKNIFAKGSIEMLSDTIKLKGVPASVSNTSGTINFNNLNADFNLNSNLNTSKIAAAGKIKDNFANIKVVSDKFVIGDGVKALASDFPYSHDLSTISTSFTGKYSGRIDNIELDKLYLKGKINSNKDTKSTIIVNDSTYELKNSVFKLPVINAKLGDMLLYMDGRITNIQKNPYLNIYVNLKPTQEFFDRFFNNKSVYPVKLKGDAIITSSITGFLNCVNTKSVLNIPENSSLYYMGASIGDAENPVRITFDNTFMPDKIRVNNFQYDKIISSQNNKPFVNTQLNASGTLTLLADNNVGFNNFRIKTQKPTDAKIFNIIFRKPFMKQGVFTSDLVLNGTSLNPKITGKFDITSIDIPFFDSTIRDVNLDFKNDKIYISSKGTVLTNDVNLEAVMKNKLTPPYFIENLKVKLADLDINKITDTMREIEVDAAQKPSYTTASSVQQFDMSQIIINKAEINADKVKVRNINADNFAAEMSVNDKSILNVNKFRFDIAEGAVLGNLTFNLINNQSNLDIHLNKANALIMSEALFDLKGQVYGSVNGDFNLACIGSSNEECFRTLSGSGKFDISDGRMPKLGSLEYLLKAGNLFKGGITGLSINSIIDLITPLKTGNFDKIYGDMHIADGVADKINVYSSGNDLNMYMSGSYNIVTSVADMKIFGSLSKNITTVFGKIKNASLNTLFNTIPGINNSNEKLLMQEEVAKIPNITNVTDIYRVFAVDVNGDINGENYVKSFKWVK